MTDVAEKLEFTLSHVRMGALAWGPSDGRLALCVHGFPDSADSWRPVATILADQGYRVVAPYTRGYAPTSLPDDGSHHIGALMTDLVELHRELGAPHDAVLIGHDWGAWTCNALAAWPESPFAEHISMALPPVQAIDVSEYGLARTLKMSAIQLRMSWYILFFQLPVRPHRTLGRVIPRLWRDWSPCDSDTGQGAAHALTALPNDAHRKAAVRYYRDMFRFTPPPAHYADLHRYRFELPCHPMLLLHGAVDGAMQVGYTEKLLDSLPAGSRTQTIPGAGHFLQVDRPGPVAEAILDYLASRPDPATQGQQ
ncbi:alpha/beta hydrolase [Mycobacterium sp. 94-17]|uniref:alpha/beta fold hydrolase n=1 Tax=Mycobacterium sp. 94-17 TaxID=2986147 RepID=UPI002D1F7BF8|nr:alpha/beta hydrolase [Mycobacterium sp. 94-17]MEB4207742.1 alpha/beta hydrolase [Mycobacterium sp. 94-17]